MLNLNDNFLIFFVFFFLTKQYIPRAEVGTVIAPEIKTKPKEMIDQFTANTEIRGEGWRREGVRGIKRKTST